MRRPSLLFSLLLLTLGAQGQAPPSPKVIERYKQMLAANPTEGTALDRLWKTYAEQGQTGQLLDEYKAGDSFAAQMIYGHLLRRAGRSDEAVTAFQNAAKLDAESPLPALALARMESERGRPKEAAAAYEKALAAMKPGDPKTAETLLALGAAWLDAGDLVQAAAAWEKTVALNPADLALRRQLADTYERNFLPDRAIEHLTYLEKNAPATERPLALQQLARIHQGAGRQNEAITALEKALTFTGPGNWLRADLESQLIRIHQRYRRTDELEARWKKYAEENPRDLGASLQLVDLYERLGNLEEQRVWLSKLTTLAPKNAEYRVRLARLLTRMEMPEAAIAIYDALLKEQSANADFVFERASLDVLRDQTAAAAQRIAALLLAKKNDETLRARALEFYGQNHLTDLVEQHLVADATAGGEEALAALANFYFSQRREEEARRTLNRLVPPAAPPAPRAAAHLRIAQLLRAQNDLDPAIAELRTAVELQPQNREAHLALGDLLAARGDYPGAQFALEQAARFSVSDAERSEADQKLFESFRAAAVSAVATRPAGTRFPFLGRGAPGDPASEPNPALDQFILNLERAANAQPSEGAWLRVARWQLWNREPNAAVLATRRALELNPKSAVAHELLVKIDTTLGQSTGAVPTLLTLAKIDPANRASYERRAGQFELQAGRIPEALAIFERLVAENPGNADALTDLALTQQRAELWAEALSTWRQVYALSPVSRRKESLAPLRRALERMRRHEESAALQLQAVEAEPGTRERLAAFNELLTFCTQHGQLDWLRGEFEKRRRLRADDYFTEVALGRILKASGDAAGAFEVLADASYAAENQGEALPELIREAEELHKLDAAVKLQAQLLRIVPQDTPDGLEKLAQLQEKNFEIEEAARTWERVVTKFPRDTEALNRAVDFQLAWGTPERALALLRRARTLEPSNLRTLATLSTLALETGATAEAESCLEQILRVTAPEKPGDPLRFPARKLTEFGRLQTAYLATVGQRRGKTTRETMDVLRSFWVDDGAGATALGRPPSPSERDARLAAIRQLSQLLLARGGPTRDAWVARWREAQTAPSEALWALYHSGAGAATLDRVEAMMKADPGDQKSAQAFIWLALQTGEYQRLGAWLRDPQRTPIERDFFFIALGQELDGQRGAVAPGLIDGLFAEGTHLRTWQAATLFAARNRFREAITLGRRVFDQASSQRAAYAQELAHWHLFLGEAESARTVLRDSLNATADSFDAPVALALREYYFLLPEKERAGFVTSYLAGIDAARQPLHAAIATALLRGLAGQEAEARAALDRLIELRPLSGSELNETASAGPRHLRFILESGSHLQTLKLENLAVDLWEKALADEALVLLQGDEAGTLARDIRQRLYALRAATAAPGEMPAWVAAFLRFAPADGVSSLAGTLSTMGAHARAIALFRQLWERAPDDSEALRNLLTACRTAGDNATPEAALRVWLRHGGGGFPDGARREFILQLADLLEQKGDLAGALAVMNGAMESAPNDTRVLLRLAQLHTRIGPPEAAMSAYQRLLVFEPGNTAARLALSALYEKHGRLADALGQLKGTPGSDLSTSLAVLLLKAGQPEAAQAVIERLVPPRHIEPSLGLATAFAAADQPRQARAVIHAALSRTEPQLSFPLQCKLIELLTPEDGAEAALRELRRLRRFSNAGENPMALLGSYLDFAAPQAARLGVEKEFAAEVRALWAEGAGPIAAGVAAVVAQAGTGNPAAITPPLDQLLAREDATDFGLQVVAEALQKAGLREALARVQERMIQLNPLNGKITLELARTLHQLGRTDAARARLETLARRAILDEDTLGDVAQAFSELGDTDRALALYAQAARGDRFARNWTTFLAYARLQTKQRDFAGAKETLRTAFTHPANRNFVEIIEWLVAAGRLEAAEIEVVDFHLTTPRVIELRRALFGYFEKAGQPAPALALAEAHPEIVEPALAPRLRQLATASRAFERAARILEKHAAEAESPDVFSLELARLLGSWAQTEIAAGQTESALAHLRTAYERHPELFEIATQLSTVLAGAGDRQAAMETLEGFLALGKNPAEIEQARAQLARLRAGG